jgi:hypothetical protein
MQLGTAPARGHTLHVSRSGSKRITASIREDSRPASRAFVCAAKPPMRRKSQAADKALSPNACSGVNTRTMRAMISQHPEERPCTMAESAPVHMREGVRKTVRERKRRTDCTWAKWLTILGCCLKIREGVAEQVSDEHTCHKLNVLVLSTGLRSIAHNSNTAQACSCSSSIRGDDHVGQAHNQVKEHKWQCMATANRRQEPLQEGAGFHVLLARVGARQVPK